MRLSKIYNYFINPKKLKHYEKNYPPQLILILKINQL